MSNVAVWRRLLCRIGLHAYDWTDRKALFVGYWVRCRYCGRRTWFDG
jgi:hypothetical protein